MGLDISVYKNLKEIKRPTFNENGLLVNEEKVWTPGSSMDWSESHWPGRAKGLNSKSFYAYEIRKFFIVGSYMNYNWWRNQLENFKNNYLKKENCFDELINFADNQGVIGPIISKKLYDDFNNNLNKAIKYQSYIINPDDKEYWLMLYNIWLNIFKEASENGAINFC